MTETLDVVINVIPDKPGTAAAEGDLGRIEAKAKAVRESMAKATTLDPTAARAGGQAAQQVLEQVSRSALQTKQSADQLKVAFDAVFTRSSSEAAVAAQTSLQASLGKTQKAALITDQEIDALMGAPSTAATTAVHGLGEEAVKTKAKFDQLKASEVGAFGTGSLGIDTSALQRYRAELVNLQRAREDSARVAGLSKGEAAQLEAIVGPTIARGRAQQDLNSLLNGGTISAQQHARAMKQVEAEYRAASSTAGSFGASVRSAFTVAAVVLAVREAGKLADAYRAVQNRLGTVTTGQEELARVTGSLFEVSNDTRASFQATAEVYARTAAATKNLGISQDSLIGFTKSLNQAVAVSGATGAEARNGLIQFSQGLAAGALRGDELRSVLEQLPAVADVIAKQFNVTRGQLRRLGEEGKLTTEQIIEAFRRAAPELEQAFAKTVPTISGAFEVLRNNVLKTIGALDATTGASATVSQGILLLAENFDAVAIAAGVLAVAVGLLTVSLTTLAAAAAAAAIAIGTILLPLAFIALGVGVVAKKLIDYRDSLEAINEANINESQEATLTLFAQQGESIVRLRRELEQVNKVYEQSGRTNQFAADRAGLLQAKINALTVAQRDGTAAAKKEEEQRQRTQAAVQKTLTDLDRETALLKLNSDEREVQSRLFKELDEIRKGGGNVGPAIAAEIEARIRNAQAAKKESDALQAARAPQTEAIKLLNEAETAFKAGAISAEKYFGALREFGRATADVAAKSNLSAGEAAIYDEVTGAITKANQALQDAEGAAAKAGKSGRDYAGVIQDLKDKLAALGQQKGLSTGQIAIQDEVVGSIKRLNDEIRDTQVLFAQAGGNADLYGEKLKGLEQRKQDVERQRASGVGDASLFTELTAQATKLDRELENISLALANLRDKSLVQPLLAKQTDTRREKEDLTRNTGLNKGEIDVLNEVKGPQIEYQRRLEDINKLKRDGSISDEEFANATDKATVAALSNATDLEAGYTRAFAKMRLEARDMASVIESALNAVVNHVTDAIITLVDTGKFKFKDFAHSLLIELEHIFLKALIVQAVTAAIGGGPVAPIAANLGASAFDSYGSGGEGGPPHRAAGGPVEAGRTYKVGERGPETFTPRQDGYITPAAQTAAAATQAPQVHLQVNNISDPDEIPRALNSGRYDTSVLNVLARNKAAVKRYSQ